MDPSSSLTRPPPQRRRGPRVPIQRGLRPAGRRPFAPAPSVRRRRLARTPRRPIGRAARPPIRRTVRPRHPLRCHGQRLDAKLAREHRGSLLLQLHRHAPDATRGRQVSFGTSKHQHGGRAENPAERSDRQSCAQPQAPGRRRSSPSRRTRRRSRHRARHRPHSPAAPSSRTQCPGRPRTRARRTGAAPPSTPAARCAGARTPPACGAAEVTPRLMLPPPLPRSFPASCSHSTCRAIVRWASPGTAIREGSS